MDLTTSSLGQSSNRRVVWLFFGTGMAVSLATAVSYIMLPMSVSHGIRLWIVTGCIGLTAIFAAGAWWIRNARIADAVLIAAWSSVLLVLLIDLGLGSGARDIGLGYFAVLVFTVALLVSLRAAAWLSAFCGSAIVGLVYAEHAHWLAPSGAVFQPLASILITQLLLLFSALSAGALVAHLIARHLAAVHAREALLSNLITASPDLITLTDLVSGKYTMVNEQFCALTGYTQAEVIGKSSLELGIWDKPEDRQHLLDALRDSPQVQGLQLVFVTKAGKHFTMRVSAARFVLNAATYLVLVARDVTAEEQARLEHAAILQNALIGIALSRSDKFVQVNSRWEQMFGWPTGALIGHPTEICFGFVPAAGDGLASSAQLSSATTELEIERPLRRYDGSIFWCRLLAKRIDLQHRSQSGTIWIAEDVTARRETEQALATARDEAESANRAKSVFLANTSHEIRTPLNGLLGLARLAIRPGLAVPELQRYVAQIHESAESLSAIITDILDLSKIEAGKLTIEVMPFDLQALLQSVHRTYQALGSERSLYFECVIDERIPAWVSGDLVRLRQILSNFVTNAFKFTAHGRITLTVTRAVGESLRFAIADTGLGIDQATLQRLFQPFTQADASTTRRYGGTGLGLSICRELAHLMGGEVGAESTPNLGSTFWVELPLAEVTAPDESTEVIAPAVDLRGVRILIVEDNPVNLLIVATMLEAQHADIARANDGAQGIAAVLHAAQIGRPFALVLMDVHMPVMNGLEATRQLRQAYDAEELPIVALTAAALVSERDEALAAGMNDFLTKPLDERRLQQALARHLGSARDHLPSTL